MPKILHESFQNYLQISWKSFRNTENSSKIPFEIPKILLKFFQIFKISSKYLENPSEITKIRQKSILKSQKPFQNAEISSQNAENLSKILSKFPRNILKILQKYRKSVKNPFEIPETFSKSWKFLPKCRKSFKDP